MIKKNLKFFVSSLIIASLANTNSFSSTLSPDNRYEVYEDNSVLIDDIIEEQELDI